MVSVERLARAFLWLSKRNSHWLRIAAHHAHANGALTLNNQLQSLLLAYERSIGNKPEEVPDVLWDTAAPVSKTDAYTSERNKGPADALARDDMDDGNKNEAEGSSLVSDLPTAAVLVDNLDAGDHVAIWKTAVDNANAARLSQSVPSQCNTALEIIAALEATLQSAQGFGELTKTKVKDALDAYVNMRRAMRRQCFLTVTEQ